MIFLLIPLVGAILAMIVTAPEDIPQPNMQSEMVTEKSGKTMPAPPSSLAVPAPGAENVPEMIVEEEHLSIEEEMVLTDVDKFLLQRDSDLEIDAEIQKIKKQIQRIIAAEEDGFHHNTAANEAAIEELEGMIEELEKLIGKPKLTAPFQVEVNIPTESFQVEVNIPTGSGIVGCEQTMECYIPSTVTVPVGGTVIWFNDDVVPHTVTSGTESDGHDAKFDSGLFVADLTFSHTFDEEGVYDYFCVVHPWMAGTVQVS